MSLELPTPTITLSPTWATELNAAIEVIDAHDHTSGKGIKIPTSGLNINGNLDFNTYKISNLKQTQYLNNASTLTGSDNAGSIYMRSGNLYFTNSSGVAVQITSGGAIASVPGAAQLFEPTDLAGDLIILNTDTFVFIRVNTSSARSITLPLCSSVSSGRIYIIKDVTGTAYTNNITVNRAGSDLIDTATSLVINSDFGSAMIIGDGTSTWNIG